MVSSISFLKKLSLSQRRNDKYRKAAITIVHQDPMAPYRYITVLLLLAVAWGVIMGAIGQKYYGFGNLLETIGIHYRPPFYPVQRPAPNPVDTSDIIPKVFQGKLALFILAGQSNMSGYGILPSEQVIDSRVFAFGNNYRWRTAQEPIDDPAGQVDPISMDGDAGVGPALAFARFLRKRNPDLVIGLIPCAKGASTIEEWQRHLSDNTLYGSCLKRIQAATTMGELAGMLVFQGEQDALDPQQALDRTLSASDYTAKFSRFVNDLRRDIARPKLPVVFAQIGTHKAPNAFINWEMIQKQQTMVDLSCAAMITTDDLALQDGVHFNTESYRIIGERYAEAIWRLMIQAQDCH